MYSCLAQVGMAVRSAKNDGMNNHYAQTPKTPFRPQNTPIPRAILITLLFTQASLLAYLSWSTSPNRTETGHIGAAVYLWHTGKLDVFHVNPPFVRALAGAPVLFERCLVCRSLIPQVMVVRDKPVALEAFVIPPGPRLIASLAAQSRRCRSFNSFFKTKNLFATTSSLIHAP